MAQPLPIPDCATCISRVGSVFSNLAESELPVLNQNKVCRRYKRGEFLYLEGEPAAGLYCVHSGKIKVFKTGQDGREQILRLAKPGDALGYRSLLDGGKHSSSSQALEETHVCFISKQMFYSLVASGPNFTLRLFEILSDELDNTEQRVVEMAQKSVLERVAETILLLQNTYGLKEDNRTLNVRITREDIANIVGSATESVIRNLTHLKDQGMIEIRGRDIQVLDSSALVRTANLSD
ncbi:MAG: Crp/Fnr family transcriptional regulator [Ignavibacteriae bacterium]|nr:Crp/Fnr family transcriptional regulator [Ignavibacteriota bacterium]MCB9214820.1 Crp/Fnr family transcriptional regulator [Ignavibacteria bacterium]